MGKAYEVARHLVQLAGSGAEPDPLTHLRLQKLLYYVQGWHLAVFGKPMFESRIEAWRKGPVVVELYPVLAHHGKACIEDLGKPENLSRTEEEFVRSVWTKYNEFSAGKLSEMTHREKPWKDAWGELPADARSNEEITLASMRDYFTSQMKQQSLTEVSPAEVYAGVEEIASGQRRTHQDVFARLRGNA